MGKVLSFLCPSEVNLFLWRVVVFYGIVGLAAFFYISKFPEKAFPGMAPLLFLAS